MCVAPYCVITKLCTLFHSWTPERTFMCKENDTESESVSGIIICTWTCTVLLVCVCVCVWKFYFSVLFSNGNFLEYIMSTVEYKYAVLVELHWQGKTVVLGEKPLAFYVPHDPQVLLWNWNQASLVRSYLNYDTPHICLGEPLYTHIVTLN